MLAHSEAMCFLSCAAVQPAAAECCPSPAADLTPVANCDVPVLVTSQLFSNRLPALWWCISYVQTWTRRLSSREGVIISYSDQSR